MEKEKQSETKERFRPAGRYRYTQYYSMRAQKQADGTIVEKAEYIGPILLAKHSQDIYIRARSFARAAAILTILLDILLISIPGFSVYHGGLYVLIPASVAIIPDLYGLLGTLKLPADDRELQEDIYRYAHLRILRSFVAVIVLHALTLLLGVVFWITGSVKPELLDLLFLLLVAGPIFLAVIMCRLIRSLHYTARQTDRVVESV